MPLLEDQHGPGRDAPVGCHSRQRALADHPVHPNPEEVASVEIRPAPARDCLGEPAPPPPSTVNLPRRCLHCEGPAPTADVWRCPCGGPWALEPFGEVPRLEALQGRPRGIWRYLEALPVDGAPITLGEGDT